MQAAFTYRSFQYNYFTNFKSKHFCAIRSQS